jgi:hypothetical protein
MFRTVVTRLDLRRDVPLMIRRLRPRMPDSSLPDIALAINQKIHSALLALEKSKNLNV